MSPAHAHAHDHAGHEHTHGEPSMASAIALRTAFYINLAFTIIEAVGGWWTGSIAAMRGTVMVMAGIACWAVGSRRWC